MSSSPGTLRSVLQNDLHNMPFQSSRITSRHFKFYVKVKQSHALYCLKTPNTERDIFKILFFESILVCFILPRLSEIHMNKAWAVTWVIKVICQNIWLLAMLAISISIKYHPSIYSYTQQVFINSLCEGIFLGTRFVALKK